MKREGVLDPSDVFKSAAHWRMRAEEMRTLADDCLEPDGESHDAPDRGRLPTRLAKHADAKSSHNSMMLRTAADYDGLVSPQGLPKPPIIPAKRRFEAAARR